jgi:hypothetical protein
MGWRKAARMRGRYAPDYVSTIMDVSSSILMVVMREEEEEDARWQSGQEAFAAANVDRSTGEVRGEGYLAASAAICLGLAAKGETENPEGTFTLICPLAAILGPL